MAMPYAKAFPWVPFKIDKIVAENRAAAIFNSALIKDPLGNSGHSESVIFFSGRKPSAAFNLVPSEFLRRAQAMPPDKPQATASAFSQWIYSIYGSAHGNDDDREHGKMAEQEILNCRMKFYGCADNELLSHIGSNWKLFYNGMQIYGQKRPCHFTIENLHVNSEQLRASPDLIYRNDLTSAVIIVEIKYSKLHITTNLWPNVWAQLWCYSQIEIALNAKKLTVIGEVWGDKRDRKVSTFCLRASVRRDPRAPAYERFFRALFNIYSGKH